MFRIESPALRRSQWVEKPQKTIIVGGTPVITQTEGKKTEGTKMSPEKSRNVQDVFLNHIRKNKTPVTVFLVNGVKLQGIVTWFDNFSVLLRRDGHTQLVYKHAISTVMPSVPVQLFEPEKADDGDSDAA